MLAAAFVLSGSVGIFGAARLRAWRQATDEELGQVSPAPPRIADAYDERLDADLAELD